MSRLNENQNLPNGLPPQMNVIMKQDILPPSSNGLGSTNTSRGSSPGLMQIPASQLPPRTSIPTSQLPPSRMQHNANVSNLTQSYSKLSVSVTNVPQITPTGSPKPIFSTSTPINSDKKGVNSEDTGNLNSSSALLSSSTISRSVLEQINADNDDNFKNVPLDIWSENVNCVPTNNSELGTNTSKDLNFTIAETRSKQEPSSNLRDGGKLPNAIQPSTSSYFSQQSNENFSASYNYQPPASSIVAKSGQNINENQSSTFPSTHTALKPPVMSTNHLQQPASTVFRTQSSTQQVSNFSTQRPFNTQSVTSANVTVPLNKPLSGQSPTPVNIQNTAQVPRMSQFPATSIQQTSVIPPIGLQVQPGVPPSNTHQTSKISPYDIQQNPLNTPSTYQQSIKTSSQINIQPGSAVFSSGSSTVLPSNPTIPPTNTEPISAIPPRSIQQSSMHQNPLIPGYGIQKSVPNNMQQYPAVSSQLSFTSASTGSFQGRTQGPRPNLHANRYPQMGQKLQETGYPAPTSHQSPYTNDTSQSQQPQNTFAGQTYIPPSQNQFSLQTPQSIYAQQKNAPHQSQGYTGVAQAGFNKMWGYENVDLLQCPNILPPTKIEPPKVSLGQDFLDAANCSPDIFRCTLTKIPETNSLLQKSRLPLGILIHPFKDLEHLPVIQCSTIVRCRACRTYINPFVFFVDAKRWKCNLCYRINELPEEFQYDPVSKTYGDPSRRPEIKSSTIEYIAPSEYMLRPPQPAVYLFLLDVSRNAVENGYLHTFCNVLAANLANLPGDARTQIGFLAFNSALHFYSLADGLNQPHEMTVLDIDDVFLPCPDNLIVNLNERKELIVDLLNQLPNRFKNSCDNYSALGSALQAAHKLIGATGGRVTVFQAVLPNKGPGALDPREDPNQRVSADVHHLNPANDFYKRLALECSGQQIAVDLFIINSQYVDLATISGISRFSGGCIYHFPLFKASRPVDNEKLERSFRRYLTRKIGFESVMRIRCTRGLAIHTFHGNFFVRSTDLLSLPNINPDAGFGMQISIEESLSDLQTVCFQAALLYTSSKGERRIRVHTLCIPVAPTLSDIINAADQQCIIGLLSKMAVDRSLQSSLSDAREAFLNVAIDVLSSYKISLNMDTNPTGLLAPNCLKLLPLYISALLKHPAFKTGSSVRLDDRVKAMCDMKTVPLYLLIQQVYPDLYPVHNLEQHAVTKNSEGEEVPQPPRLQLSARSLENKGAYIMDQGDTMILFICSSVSVDFIASVFGVSDYNAIPDDICELPLWENPCSQRLNMFINYLNDEKPFPVVLQVIRDNSPNRHLFIERLLEDRVENALSYHEFLQHLKTQVK